MLRLIEVAYERLSSLSPDTEVVVARSRAKARGAMNEVLKERAGYGAALHRVDSHK